MARKGDWVQIHVVVLRPEERAANIPEDTRIVPLEMWVKGRLADEQAEIGDLVCIETRTGRRETGRLCAVNPSYSHSFGDYIPELLTIDEQVRSLVFGGESDD